MMKFPSALVAATLLVMTAAPLRAEVQSKEIRYQVGDLQAHGYLAWDDRFEGPRPGVLVIHEWWGLNDYARQRANQLAELGYVAFACDMYGEGKTVDHPQDAGRMASMVRANVDEWRKRAEVALKVLREQPQCDSERLAAIGYCFGGSTTLQLAYTGADLDAVVTFHAALPVPSKEDAQKIKSTIQVHHGANDTFIPQETIEKFQAALTEANVDWAMTSYGGAVHSFSVKGSDEKGIDGIAYDEKADQRSWDAMLDLFRHAGMPPRK